MPITSFRGEYRFLSNFHPSPIKYKNKDYATAEHLYQALKCTNEVEHERVRNSGTAAIAKALGKIVELRKDFERVKIDIMDEVLHLKFGQNKDLADKLVATGTEELIETNWWKDSFWGVCDRHGENWLGKLLMQLRAELQNSY